MPPLSSQTKQILLEPLREELRVAIVSVIGLWAQGQPFTHEKVQYCMRKFDHAARGLFEVVNTVVLLADLMPQVLEMVDLGIRAHMEQARLIGEGNFSLICNEILRIALFPDILLALDVSKLTSYFARDAAVANLQRLRHLTSLALPGDYDCGPRVALSIRHLPSLKQFEYRSKCSDSIIREICNHCRYISDLDVKCSKKVTDRSVALLVDRAYLTRLDVASTSISDLGYSALLANLPQLRKLSWKGDIDDVLGAADDNGLRNVVEFDGRLRNAQELVRKCPNLESMVVSGGVEDMTPFAGLRFLKTLRLIGLNYASSMLPTVLPAIGPRLETLSLEFVVDLDMVDVIEHCGQLKRLVIKDSDFVRGLPEREVHNGPHFHNLSVLMLCNNRYAEWYHQMLRRYTFLTVLKGRMVPDFNDQFFFNAIKTGGFQCLRDLFLYSCGDLSRSTFHLVNRFCPNLKAIGCLRNWSRVPNTFIHIAQQSIKGQNIELKLTDCGHCDVAPETIYV